MSEAIFGLLGVVIGSAITWGIEIWRARRTDSDQARVAARLVADELRSIDNARTAGEPELTRLRELALAQDAWITHRAILARELSNEGWKAIRDAYDALASPQSSPEGEESVRTRCAGAMNALESLMSSDRRYWWQRIANRLRGRAWIDAL